MKWIPLHKLRPPFLVNYALGKKSFSAKVLVLIQISTRYYALCLLKSTIWQPGVVTFIKGPGPGLGPTRLPPRVAGTVGLPPYRATRGST